MRTHIAAVLVVPVLLAVGCATTTPSVAANGEPLDARGRWVTHKPYVTTWGDYIEERTDFEFDGHYQGSEKIDELDFFTIAGDESLAKKVVTWREKQNRAYMITWGVSGLSAAAFVGGAAVFTALGGFGDNAGPAAASIEGRAALGAMVAGASGFGLAYLAFPFFGPGAPAHGDGPVIVHIDDARQAADEYNARRGDGGSAPAPTNDVTTNKGTTDEGT